MGETTGISWTDKTFNPWWGCARVSPGCVNCYADRDATRWGMPDLWHQHGPRRMMSENYWRQPAKWNREAAAAGQHVKVFCASMADVFEDHPEVTEARKRLFGLIEETPWLTWQLLTKRPENIPAMTSWGASGWPANAWVGTSVENQDFAQERILRLLRNVPSAQLLFLSCEPLLGPVDLRNIRAGNGALVDCLAGDVKTSLGEIYAACPASISWVITGGESGPETKRREMDPAWLTSIVEACRTAGVPVWTKQDSGPRSGHQGRIPDDLWLHQFPITYRRAA
jgi:protein gp37